MAKLVWDETGDHLYTTGVSNVVLFVQNDDGTYANGVAWSGVTSIEESPDGGDANDFYADNIKYLSLRGVENFGATINAYQSPAEFDVCDGTASLGLGVRIGQQVRRPFAFAFKTLIGNDTQLTDYGYELHIVYNATCSPSSRTYETVNDSPEPAELSWEVDTTPINVLTKVGGVSMKPTSHVIIDSKTIREADLKEIEDSLYGTDTVDNVEGTPSTLLTPDQIITILNKTRP